MKTELTPKESKHLIKLGAPKEKASAIYIDGDTTIDGIELSSMSVSDVFSLTDLLEILPKVMYKDGLAYDYNLVLYWEEDMKLWRVVYDAIGENMSSVEAPELIDALYQLACWYYGEYLKSEKK